MIKQIFLIKDTKAELYNGPFVSFNLQVFERELMSLKDSDTQYGRHPSDFAVYSAGSINDSTGCITALPPEHILNLDDLFARGASNV